MRNPGLRQLEELILSGTEHASIVVRPTMCSSAQDSNALGEIVRDVAALANLSVRSPRLVVFGITQHNGRCEVHGLTETDHVVGAKLERVLAKYLEPQLHLRYTRWRMSSKSLGVLFIEGCEDAPYFVRKDAAPVTQVGDLWTRRRNHSVRMRRSELDKLYAERLVGPLYDGRVRVQFAGEAPSEFIRLQTANAAQLPSKIAADKIAALIDARQLAMATASSEMTYIGRLSQARIMGCDAAYADKGITTLRLELARVEETFRTADAHFRAEQQAHAINLQLALDGDCDIDCASLVVHIPSNVGLTVSDTHASAALSTNASGTMHGKPHVEITRDVIRVSENYEKIPARQRITAFRQPLQVVVDSTAAGHKIPVHYRLHGRNLRYPISGKLYIICAA